MSWVERACNITSGVFTAVECVGFLTAALKDVRYVNKLVQVADIAGDVKIKSMANAIQQAPTLARAAQRAAEYNQDVFSVTLLKKGHRIYGGLPGQTEWYTDLASLEASGYSRSKLFQGLQVKPNPVQGYRPQVGVYEVLEDVVVAEGITLANPQFGIGGYHQFFVEQYKKVLKLVEVIDLAE